MKLQHFLFLTFFVFSCSDSSEKETLRVATAANAQFALQEIAREFSRQEGYECQLVIGSSGKLVSQIREGAPFDVFISADMDYPLALFSEGFSEGEPQLFCKGKMVIWSNVEEVLAQLDSLNSEAVRHIALPNPEIAPYGKAAVQILSNLGIFPTVEKKLVYGESIAQTNQFVVTRSAEVGFTAKSVVLSPEIKEKGFWSEIPDSLYNPILQGMVILKGNGFNSEAKAAFRDFIFSPKGQEILHRYGYLSP